MENQEFINYLRKYFGNKVLNVLVDTENGIIIDSKKIKQFNDNAVIDQNDKCKDCIATKYRQDMPFWINGHRNKKIMVISQDAGKGYEDYKKINTVFDMHSFQLNEDEYVNKHITHEKYLELFRLITGKKNFLEDIYFTDIIKCAFSSDEKIKPNSCLCSKNIFLEIEEVNPNVIILMGSPAQNIFSKLLSQKDYKMEIVSEISTKINKNTPIQFSHIKTNNQDVFFMPHFIGNLYISNDFKNDFIDFKEKCCLQINNFIK